MGPFGQRPRWAGTWATVVMGLRSGFKARRDNFEQAEAVRGGHLASQHPPPPIPLPHFSRCRSLSGTKGGVCLQHPLTPPI